MQQYGRFDNLARQGGDPAQRHPPGGLRRRADAAPDRRCTSIEFDEAWELTRGTIGYTNHTLLPEALETWPVPLFERLLPRHMQIIYEINARLLKEARNAHRMSDAEIRNDQPDRRDRRAAGADGQPRLRRRALDQRRLGAAFRAAEGDGLQGPPPDVPGPHQQQDQRHHPAALADAVQPRPDRAHHRHDRRRASSTTSTRLRDLEPHADGPGVPGRLRARSSGSTRTGWRSVVRDRMGIRIDPNALFDIQVKRIHEYKRQLLNIIEAVALYDQIRSHPELNWVPRVKIFAGKAAPTYHNAKLIIKLANDVARVINSNPTVRERAEGGVRAELQRQPRRDAGARRRSLRADLDRRHGGLGHRQHEVRAERRADHRHARRRQRRDPRAGRDRRTSSSSA